MHPQVSEAELQSALSPAGFVWELKVPRNPDGTPSPPLCLAARLEDCVLVTLLLGSLAVRLHGGQFWVHGSCGAEDRALIKCRPGARVCIRWFHVPGACGEGDRDR